MRILRRDLPIRSHTFEGVRKMVREFNIFIAGVGGQGTILMAEILGEAATIEGLKVRGSEILGMAVRGGPVSSIIRVGSEVYGPLVPEGKGDVLVGLEPTEALRNIEYLSKNGTAIINTRPIVPYTVPLGLTKYPPIKNVLETLRGKSRKVIALDATKLAKEAGTPVATNMIMLGVLAGTTKLPIGNKTLKKIMKARFSTEMAQINIKAFDLGFEVSRNLAKRS
jgi:indolepyruvate ferredoxin oxidoreductase beta subunit